MKLAPVTQIKGILILAAVIFVYTINDGAKLRTRNAKIGKNVEEDDRISPGIIILGMHRSGTSLLAGLLSKGCGYHLGDNLLVPHPDNPKGFYEREDTVSQNNQWFGTQRMSWDKDDLLHLYDPELVLFKQNPWEEIIEKDIILTEEHGKTYEQDMPGVRSLEFLTNRKNRPWLLKEPRLCITLPAWLDQLERSSVRYAQDNIEGPTAILTYRHPIEVAESLLQRDEFPISKGFLLWLIYNRRAIENSVDLCKVYTSNYEINKDPFTEISRITNELTEKCGVPPPPKEINQNVLDLFLDEELEHTHYEFDGEGDCFDHEFTRAKDELKNEAYFREVIEVYCDLRNGKAYEPDYIFPSFWQ